MKFVRFFVFMAAAGLLFITSCAKFQRVERADLKTFIPDYHGLFTTERKTRGITVLSKDGEVMYRKVYEKAEPMPDYVPADIELMMDYAGKKLISCDRPTDRELLELKYYDAETAGLDDCFVLWLGEKASAGYKNEKFRRLMSLYTASDLLKEFGPEKLHRIYMAQAYMQNDVWGMQSASRFYFGKNIDAAEASQKVWLMSLLSLGYLPFEHRDGFYGRMADLASYVSSQGFDGYGSPYLNIDYTKDKEINNYPELNALIFAEMDRRGINPSDNITVTSGLSMKTMRMAQEAVDERMAVNPKGMSTAIVIINYEDASIEGFAASSRARYRVTGMKRQIGSTFKPVVYLTAFTNGIRPNQLVWDKKYEYHNYGQPYSPSNFEDYYMGVSPLRNGLVNYNNNATIRLARIAGLEKVADTAKRLGMEYDVKPYLAMPLGIFPLTPLNVAKVYSVLGNGGVKNDIGFITDVRDGQGRQVYYDRALPERIVPETAAFQTLFIMQDVVRRGTARGSGLIDGTSAKTGTTDEYKDAWTAAVFEPYAVVAWAGYDDNRSMGEKGTGGALAAPLAAAFERRILENVQKIDLKVPQGIVFKKVDNYRGAAINDSCRAKRTYIEAFAEDNLPIDCAALAAEDFSKPKGVVTK